MPGRPRIPTEKIEKIAIIGTGNIGRSWAYVFARARCETRLYDREPWQMESALNWLEETLRAEYREGFISQEEMEARRARISVHTSIREAVKGVQYVQESGPERLEVKQGIFSRLERRTSADALICSSTAMLDITEIVAGLKNAHRFLTVHPVNPPHVVPLVEIVPGAATAPEIVSLGKAFLLSIGQKPVVLKKFVPGLLVNRLQAALFREAIHLVAGGAASVQDVENAVTEGLGLRWALMGPFMLADASADGGIREYLFRYGDPYSRLMSLLEASPRLDLDTIEMLGQGVDAMKSQIHNSDLQQWRNTLIEKLKALKKDHPSPGGLH